MANGERYANENGDGTNADRRTQSERVRPPHHDDYYYNYYYYSAQPLYNLTVVRIRGVLFDRPAAAAAAVAIPPSKAAVEGGFHGK